MEFLKSHPAIDPQNIGVIGHSQGGWVVNLVASQHDDIPFFISLAGPTTSVIGNMEDNYRGAYMCEGFEGEEAVVISQATHGFTISDTPCVTYEERQKLPQSEELVSRLESWLTEQGY